MPRDWTFRAELYEEFSCKGAEVGDLVDYQAGPISFSLDDKLNVTNIGHADFTVDFFGKDPTSCDPKHEKDFKRIDPTKLQFTLKGGDWDADLDQLFLSLDWVFPTSLGYNYTRVADDGTTFPSQYSPGPPAVVPGLTYPVDEGTVPYDFPFASASDILYTWTLRRVTTGCP